MSHICKRRHAHGSAERRADCEAGLTPRIPVAGVINVGRERREIDRVEWLERELEGLRKRVARLERRLDGKH